MYQKIRKMTLKFSSMLLAVIALVLAPIGIPYTLFIAFITHEDAEEFKEFLKELGETWLDMLLGRI